jgi:hypothetical protein
VVEISGYQGEPMLQVRPDGVYQNRHAPSIYVDTPAAAAGAGADIHAAPDWVRVTSEPVARWQDHRALWHGTVPPPQVRLDPGHAHRIANWAVPVREGDATGRIIGTLDWVPPPPAWAWWTMVVLLAAALIAIGVASTRSSSALWRWLLGAAGFTAGFAALAYPLVVVVANVQPGLGAVAVALVSQAVPVLTGLALMAAGEAVLSRRAFADFILVFGGVSTAFVALISNGAVFSHSVAPVPGGGWWARLAVLLALGGGLGLAGAAVARMRTASRTSVEPATSI